jgi:DNA-binding NtrC family response regulator
MSDTLLVIEDETLLGSELSRHFRKGGWEVVLVETLAGARQELLERALDPLVVLADMNLPDGNALDLLEQVRTATTRGEWIFLTAFGSVPDSVRALRLGAIDFLEKPCDIERLDLVVAGAARSARAQRRILDMSAAKTREFSPGSFVGRSGAARSTRQMLEKLSRVPFSTLLVTGETGVGKGLAARILHHSGPRADGPMVELNCAAMPKDLLESELFGHEAGAFTGARGRRRGLMEQAHGGTLFLDEIGELEGHLQAKLLKAIEQRAFRRVGGEREVRVDVQIIAASNIDLTAAIEEGRFRSDLYHRLSAFQLPLPPLRERREDLEDLVPLFVAEFNALASRDVRVIPDQAWQVLKRHEWPGNVRELRNVVERCVLLAEHEVFNVGWAQLPTDGLPGEPAGPGARIEDAGGAAQVEGDRLCIPLNGSMALDDMDRFIIKTTLERCGHNITATARALGTTRETVRYRVQKYGLKTSRG